MHYGTNNQRRILPDESSNRFKDNNFTVTLMSNKYFLNDRQRIFLDNFSTQIAGRHLNNENQMPPFPADRANFSNLARLFMTAESLNDYYKDSFVTFHQSIRSAAETGLIDTAAIAYCAPLQVKLLAIQLGINLESSLNEFFLCFSQMSIDYHKENVPMPSAASAE